jgi:hypothetical protein
MKKYSLALFLIIMAENVFAQKYMFVYNPDKYVAIRKDTIPQSQIVDTLFNLQLVKIEKDFQLNGWRKVIKNEKSQGYVHQRWLRSLPESYEATLDSLFCPESRMRGNDKLAYGKIAVSGYEFGSAFVAAIDCSEIIVQFTYPVYRLRTHLYPYEGYAYNYLHSINVDPVNVVIINAKTGELLEYRDEYAAFSQIEILDGRILFKEAFEYSFYRNRKGKMCRGLIPYRSYITLPPEEKELPKLIDSAKKAVERAKKSAQPSKSLKESLGKNTTEYMEKLRHAFFCGNKDATVYYPYIIKNLLWEEGENHDIIDYRFELWGYENLGEVEL